MTKLDILAAEQVIAEVAATEVMTRFRKLEKDDVTMKGVNDPVTIADKESERQLTARLGALIKGSKVVGEESFAVDKSVMTYLEGRDPVWIIDPIDGTRNFIAGIPEFAIMVALVKNHQALAAWIHDPNSKDTIMAEKGSGVWLRGSRVTLASLDETQATVGLVGARVKALISDPNVMPKVNDTPAIEVGSCAGFDYPRLFTGPVAFANANAKRAGFLLYRHTNAWDHMPGMFLHQEAGGYSADWDNNPYDMTRPRSGLLYAKDEATWQKLHSFFEPLMRHIKHKTPE